MPVQEVKVGEWQLVVLGNLYDPDNQAYSNRDIVKALAQDLLQENGGYETVEHALSRLAGRWVLIVGSPSTTRIYHDACGLKSVFYTMGSSQERVVASQPALIEDIGSTVRDLNIVDQIEQGSNWGCWPVNVTPYLNVAQLIPNHWLDLDTGRTGRYWPTSTVQERPLKDVASEMADMISKTIGAMASRDKLTFSVTGGIDSRMLIACCPEAVRRQSTFFTIKTKTTPGYDISIPKRIEKMADLDYRVFSPEPSPVPTEVLHANVGSMILYESVAGTHAQAEAVGDQVHCIGITSEVFRCRYYSDGIHPVELDAAELTRRAGFGTNPLAISGAARWLESFPEDAGIPLLDLFHWECRLGVWGSCLLTFRETLIEQIPPFNSRRLLELGLSAPVLDRCEPYRLARAIIESGFPALNSLPHNPEPFGRLRAAGRAAPLPWRIKKFLRLT